MAITDEYMPDDMPEAEEEDQRPPIEILAELMASENLAAERDSEELATIASEALSDYRMDKESMADWFEQMKRGLDLARLVKSDKTYPFKNAANVKYPLITSAALQFNARSMPAIVPPDRPVRAKVWGKDADGAKAARAERISEHMSYQLSAEIPEWEEETDNLLVQLPIVGEMFRKWWFDPVEGRPKCRLIEPGKFILNDRCKSIADAPRCTEELELYPAEIESRVRSGWFVEFEYDKETADKSDAQEFIEQHCRLDLDDDGYEEPYVVTVHCDTQTIVRLVADFDEEDVTFETEEQLVPSMQVVQDPFTGQSVQVEQMVPQQVPTRVIAIKRGTYFVSFKFLPGLDGGFHGTGLGLLLGDISETINTIINQLLDAGHYASLGGGFIGTEVRMKGGSQRHAPGEWKLTSNSGADLRSGVFPLTFPGPNATLYEMLGMLIEAGREIASVKDVVTGDAQRQQTATTTLALIEQGMMVFTAAYKRIFRSCKDEYKLLAKINGRTISPEKYAAFHEEQVDPQQDYDLTGMDIQPVADPRSVTKMQQASKAQLVMELAQMGMADPGAAMVRITEAMDIEDPEELAPQPNPMQEEMAMLGLQNAKADVALRMAEIQLTIAKIGRERAEAVKAFADAQNDTDRVAIEAKQQQIDGLLRILEDERKGLEAVLRGSGGVAGKSGDGNASQGNGGNARRAEAALIQGVAVGGVPGGQGGSGTGGFAPM